MKPGDPPYSHPVATATLHGDTHLKLRPDADARARIAKALNLDAVNALALDLAISQAANGLVTVSGTLEAAVRPVCVVSLEAFDEAISSPLELRLAPPDLIARMTARAEKDGDEDFEPPDEIAGGVIDFGALATEFLALALDPYPKKPGAAFSGGDPEEPRRSPFEALKALKTEAKD